MGTRCADHVTPLYPQKLALTSPTGGGSSFGIVRSRTKATELVLDLVMMQIFVVCDRLGFWLGKKHINTEFGERTTASNVYSELNYYGVMVLSTVQQLFLINLVFFLLQTEKRREGNPLVMVQMPLAVQSHLLPKTSSRP